MGREFELKFAASEEALAALERDFSGFVPISMETTYYDLPDGTFSGLRWTFRRRMENGRSVCTLKTPAGGNARGEWETECDDILEAVPLLCAMGAPESLAGFTAGGVIKVCGARFTRLAAHLEIDGAAAELALDRGILTGGGKELPFREVEVELKSGSEAAVTAFAEKLAAKYSLTPQPRSKVARAMDLAKS